MPFLYFTTIISEIKSRVVDPDPDSMFCESGSRGNNTVNFLFILITIEEEIV
jgi:hypothetical protein